MKIINEILLNFALQSLREGISVFPVGKDKKPLISWKQFQTRYASEDEVRSWFNTYEDPQIGFATGKLSNLLVVDVEREGDPSFLPQETTIVQTGGGGYHYYFLYEEGIRNLTRFKPFVDCRGEGGYVVSPFSVSEKGPYSILQKAPLIKFPRTLIPPKVDIFEITTAGHSTMFEKKDLQHYPGYGAGQRNDEMTRYIGYLLTQIHPSDWDSQGWHLVKQANQRNTPPLGLGELQQSFNSIKRTEKTANPLGRATREYSSSSTIPAPILSEDGSDEVLHIADAAAKQVIDTGTAYPLGMPCFDKLYGGGVRAGNIVIISGQTGHGKTSLAQDWTLSLVRGENKIKALWFSFEVMVADLWIKFQEMGMTKEDLAFIPIRNAPGNIEWIEKKVKEGKEKFGIKAVFIDHIGFLLPKSSSMAGKKNMSSNYASYLTQIMRDLKNLAIQEEIIIFLPVPMKKVETRNRVSDTDDIRDSGGIAAEADLVFLIEREKNKDKAVRTYFTDTTTITLSKNRKYGSTFIGKFTMLKGRFAYDDTEDKANEAFDAIGKEPEVIAKTAEKEITIKIQTLELITKKEEEVPKVEGIWDNLDIDGVTEPIDD